MTAGAEATHEDAQHARPLAARGPRDISRPVTSGSSPRPLMSLPISSRISRSMSSRAAQGGAAGPARGARSRSPRVLRRHDPQHRRAVVLVLDECHAEHDVRPVHDRAGGAGHGLGHTAYHTEAVVVLGTGPLAEADRQLLQQPALDGPMKSVWAHAVTRTMPSASQAKRSRKRGCRRFAKRDDLHGGTDRRADSRLSDTELREHLGLALGGGPAVRAHRRHDEGIEAGGSEARDDAADQHGDSAMPRLPTATAMLAPGASAVSGVVARGHSASSAASTSTAGKTSKASRFEHGRQVRLVSGDGPHHERKRHPDLQAALRGQAYREAPAAFAAGRRSTRSAAAAGRGIIPRRPRVPPSSSGLGHRPFKPAARIRIPLGAPVFSLQHGTASTPSGSAANAGLVPICRGRT